MENLDDLDNSIFGTGYKSKDPKISTVTESKKKVMFKDFDDNDPLGDLNLSDDEDFQESPKEKSPAIVKDNKIANLFGIKDEDEAEAKDPFPVKDSVIDEPAIKTSPLLPVKSSLEKQPQEPILKESDFLGSSANVPVASKPENPTQKSNPKMKSIFDDDDDVASNLLDKPKMSSNSQAKKSSLMEDLFGSRPKSSPDASRRKSTFNFDVPSVRPSPGESLTGLLNESASKTSNVSGYSLSASKEPRRGRRATTTVQNDPLGLLSASTLQIDETPKPEAKQTYSPVIESTPKSAAVAEDLPEWLGGPKVSKEQKQETEKTARSEVSSAKSTETLGKILASTDTPVPVPATDHTNQSNLASKLLSIEFDQQASIINMQQQEHELRTAAALSQQSEKLNYLLETQKVKLSEQEKQFNMLIARQLERQSLLEAQMKAQQDRINSYIQTLTAQPTTIPTMPLEIAKQIKLDSKEPMDEKGESESHVQKLQLEKLYLENTLESLREKHEKEITILEDSYKKQIQFLEEAMVQMEKRMQDDVECLEADYKTKIKKLKEEMAEAERTYKEEKEALREENTRLIQEIQVRHSRGLEILQKEHIEIIEKITKSKESERQAIEIMKVDGINVQNILNKSEVIIESLDGLQNKFESRDNKFIESQDHHLSIQEKNIEYLKELLEKQKDDFVEEKQKLMTTIQKLGSETSELISEFRKQNASFKESEEILKSREQALLRDREIFVEQTKWERERLQAMRETWAKEEDRQLEWLAQERQTLVTERGKLQLFNRLKIGVDESSKIELEATIKAAQNAAASANQDRLRWQEKINELEMQQNALQEKENRLILKAKELQDFTQSAIAKREEGLRALKEAHFIEERYKEKLNQLQMQEEILTQRENKLAAEKLELARERLAFRSGELDRPEKDVIRNVNIGTSRHDDQSNLSELQPSTQCTTYFKDIVDPHLVLLKWNLESKLEDTREFPFTFT